MGKVLLWPGRVGGVNRDFSGGWPGLGGIASQVGTVTPSAGLVSTPFTLLSLWSARTRPRTGSSLSSGGSLPSAEPLGLQLRSVWAAAPLRPVSAGDHPWPPRRPGFSAVSRAVQEPGLPAPTSSGLSCLPFWPASQNRGARGLLSHMPQGGESKCLRSGAPWGLPIHGGLPVAARPHR